MKQTIKVMCNVLLFALLSFSAFAQNTGGTKVVTGTVTDAAGIPIPGANILEKGTKNGAITDFDGHYTIVVKKGAVLTFAYIGMLKQEKAVGNGASVDVAMKEDTTELENVVVVGYGAQKKSHLTGAIETVKMSEIVDLPAGDLGTAIQGRVLGVSVTGGAARPGVKSSLQLRQNFSLAKDGGNTNPLYVIDGMLQIAPDGTNDSTLFSNLDANEVESISFLKDGSAAIYGARSAQGVVIVTTKKGKIGAPKFSYSGTYGVDDKTYQTKVLNAYEFGQYVNILNGPNGNNASATDKTKLFSPDELAYFKTLNNTYLDDEWHPSYTTRHNLNVSGGSDKATYFAGVSYYKQNGNLSTLEYDKWNYRSGVDVNLSSNWKATLQVSGYYSDQTKTFNKIGGENDENDYNNLLTHLPYVPNYINGLPVEVAGNNVANLRYHYPEIQRLGNLAETTASTMTVNMATEYKVPFIKGLSLRGSYARNMNNSRGTQVGTSYDLYQFTGLGTNGHILDDDITTYTKKNTYTNGDRLYFSNTTGNTQQYNFNTIYERTFGDHTISGLFSIEKSESVSNNEVVFKSGVLLDNNGQFNTASGTIDGSTSKSVAGNLGYVGRLNYSYKDKYLAEGLFRTDASTKFAPANYWGKFYSISAGWVVSKEDFFKSKVIDFLKFRYSIGQLGKDDTSAWLWRQRYTFQQYKGAVFGNNTNIGNGWKMEAAPNPNATWSNELKTNFGTDAKFLNNRLSLTLESYYNVGTNMLINRTGDVPFTVGGTVAPENYGKIDTYGYEVALGWNDKAGKNIRYGVDLRFSYGDNKVIQANYVAEDMLKPWNPKNGQSSDNGVWGYDYLGMFKNQADIDNYVSTYHITAIKTLDGTSTPAANFRPGMLYYKDVRGAYLGNGKFAAPDGIIDQNDQIQLAKKANSHYGISSTLKFAYKSFSLNAVIVASIGGWSDISSTARNPLKSTISQITGNTVKIWNNIYDPVLNPDGTMPNPYFSATNNIQSTFWEVNAFRMSCKNINLSYAMPEKALKAMNMGSCKFNLTVLNPFNFYNPYSFQGPTDSYLNYPTLRTISLGLNLGL